MGCTNKLKEWRDIDPTMRIYFSFFLVLALFFFQPRPLCAESARVFKTASLDSLRSKPELQYKEAPSVLSSLFSDLIQWALAKLAPYLATKTTLLIFKIIGYLLALLAVAMIIRYILIGDGSALFGKKDENILLSNSIDSDDIYAIDLIKILRECEQDGRYREAVRARYLITLKTLADRGDIQWRKGKTNDDYLYELRQRDNLQHEFVELTRKFEFIWYGGEEINQNMYKELNVRFAGFLSEDVDV